MKIGFVGLGSMGSGMARNLIKAGHTLTVLQPNAKPRGRVEPLGAKVADTPAEAASGADVLITMLADDHAVGSIAIRTILSRSTRQV